MNVGIHPALNRFIAGLDMVTNGVRVMFNAAGPADIEALQRQTMAAFEETAKFERAVANVLMKLECPPPSVTVGSPEHVVYERDLEMIRSRLKG